MDNYDIFLMISYGLILIAIDIKFAFVMLTLINILLISFLIIEKQ